MASIGGMSSRFCLVLMEHLSGKLSAAKSIDRACQDATCVAKMYLSCRYRGLEVFDPHGMPCAG
jgi:hypothetical protein